MPSASPSPDDALDWSALSNRLSTDIAQAVRTLSTHGVGASHVALIDLHVRDMLVLWPTIAVYPCDQAPPHIVESSRDGDRCAAAVTALGGPGGTRWDVLFSRFHRMLDDARTAATRSTGLPILLGENSSEDKVPKTGLDTWLHPDSPLDYRPLAAELAQRPDLDEQLAWTLSSDTVRDIDAEDVAVALAALSSPWHTIRRHASIVLLSAHL